MCDAYFGFQRRPFGAVPQTDLYFPAAAIEAARKTLTRCIERGEGAGMVVGPSGIGKTMLCRVLAGQFGETFKVAMLSSGRLSTRRALLQAILYELGRPYRGMDEGELRLALVDHLKTSEDCPRGMLLLVDEAHCLPLRLLEEIRMLTNVTGGGQPRVRLVLVGGCVLEERFANPKLDSLSQQIVARCYLESLNRTETSAYIHQRIQSAGGAGERLFPQQASESVFRATDGVPRLINQVCDHALLLAYAAGREDLDAALIEEAWADLQQLPAPLSEEVGSPSTTGEVIEFGSLEDLPPQTDELPEGEADGSRQPQAASLRISPETSEAVLKGEDPDRELQRIEQMLAGVDEDFRPAGSIGPEVELVFDEPEQMFNEEFEQEEIVADRYTPGSEDRCWQPAAEAEPSRREPVEPPPTAAPAATLQVAALQRHDYGRLFAKLRRG